MKRLTAALTAAVTALALVSCGDTSAADNLIQKNESIAAAATETTTTTTAASAEDAPAETAAAESPEDSSEIDDYLSYVPPVETKSYAPDVDTKNGDIDVDLTVLNATMTYSQVYDMVTNPSLYEGKKVRAKGTFAHTNENGRDYFAALVKDATACCSQGIEFVPADDLKFPDDYPPIDTEIIITGTFSSYQESVFTYIELQDAEMTVA